MTHNDLRQKHDVYPTQAIVSAYAILKAFNTLEEAKKDTGKGWCAAEGCTEVPGAGGVASRVIDAFLNYKEDRKRDKYVALTHLLAELHYQWIHLTGPGSGNFEKNFMEGLTKGLQLEREFMSLLSEKENEFFGDKLEIYPEKVDVETVKLINAF
jgi:hypothetical protein